MLKVARQPMLPSSQPVNGQNTVLANPAIRVSAVTLRR